MVNKQQSQNVNFEKFAIEVNNYINKLSESLGHPDEQNRVYILLRSVLWTIRDRIQITESFDLISQFPMMLSSVYTYDWKYHEKPPLDYDTIEGMTKAVENQQSNLGEQHFDWGKSTEELVSIVINSLKEFVSQGQIDQIRGQMPKEVQKLVK